MNTNFNLTAKRNSTQKMRLFFLTLASAIVLSSCSKNNSSDNPPPPPPPPPGIGAVGGPVNCANYSPQGLGTLPTRPGVYGQGGYYGDDANSAICAIQLRYVRAELICEMNVRNSSGLLKNTRPLMIYRWNLLTEGMTFPRQFSLVGYIQSFQNGYPIKNSAHFIGNVQGISMTDRNGLLNWTGNGQGYPGSSPYQGNQYSGNYNSGSTGYSFYAGYSANSGSQDYYDDDRRNESNGRYSGGKHFRDRDQQNMNPNQPVILLNFTYEHQIEGSGYPNQQLPSYQIAVPVGAGRVHVVDGAQFTSYGLNYTSENYDDVSCIFDGQPRMGITPPARN